jgi:hypothetical protein
MCCIKKYGRELGLHMGMLPLQVITNLSSSLPNSLPLFLLFGKTMFQEFSLLFSLSDKSFISFFLLGGFISFAFTKSEPKTKQ